MSGWGGRDGWPPHPCYVGVDAVVGVVHLSPVSLVGLPASWKHGLWWLCGAVMVACSEDASPPVLFPVAIALPVRRVRCLCCAVCVLGMSGCCCECDAGVVGLSGWGFVWGRVVSV